MIPTGVLGCSVQELGDSGHLPVAAILLLALTQLADAGGDRQGGGGGTRRLHRGTSASGGIGLGTPSAQLAKVIAELLVLAWRGSDFSPDNARRAGRRTVIFDGRAGRFYTLTYVLPGCHTHE